ncbi:CHAT domain-containing protein [Aquimarina latercula]|uniref:CHAT domain-containing protein n=1 Tax=Aquimarina latercula TaxID=987 RepID=UPI0003F9963D|nr:CHAT domain-containing tetratricopeptide repeat protein [Aquimarina latercula]
MNSLKTIVFFLFFSSLSFSQTKIVNDTILASQYFKKADSLFNDRKLDSSSLYFKKALPIYQKAEVWEQVAQCYNRISKNQWATHKLEKSLKNSNKAIEICKTYLSFENKEVARAFDNIGNYYTRIPDFEQALLYFEKALDIRKQIFSKNDREMALSYSHLAVIHTRTSNYKKAIKFNKKAAKLHAEILGPYHRNTGFNYNNLGYVYSALGKYEEAIDFYNKALEVSIKNNGENHLGVADNYINIGSAYFRLMHNEKALKCFQKALSIYKKNNYSKGLSTVYMNIGSVISNEGKDIEALKYYKRSLDIKLKIYGKDHPKTTLNYTNIGTIYRDRGDFKNALEYYNKALEIRKSSTGENHNKVAFTYRIIGNTYIKNKEYYRARDYFNKALQIYNNIFDNENHPEKAIIYENIGDSYFENGLYDQALLSYQKGLIMFQHIYGESHPLIANLYNSIAKVYSKQNRYNKGITFFNKALHSNFINNNSFECIDNFNSNQYYNLEVLLETLFGKGDLFKSKYILNRDINDFNKQLEIHRKVDLLIDHLRQSFQNYEDKILLGNKVKEVYKSAVHLHVLYSNQNQNSLRNAFYFAEKSKSNTLKDILDDSNAKSFSGLSIDLVDLEKKLRISKAFYQSRINEEFSKKESDSTKIMEYENRLFSISRRQDSLTEVIEKKYPKYHQLKYTNEVVSVADVQEKLDDETTLLEFFTTDSITYAFTISKNKIAVKELLTPKLERHIEEFQGAITKNYEVYKELSHQLYKKLIAPVKNEFVGNQLIIVPDGSLWHLNFDLLLTAEDTSDNPKTWPYLLKEYAISYANSATLLFQNKIDEGVAPKELQECLAFSFSSGDNLSNTRNVSLKAFRNSSMDLPGTREEIKAISNIVDGQYFYGSEATEQNFKKHAGAYNILHLALHGDVDNERPENSKLYFTKSKDTVEDNYLYSHELFALDIPAELTVLSACNTGTGKIAKGEGIMSLGNAFQYAGTKSLLLTNWEVSDETTPKIMEYFYTNLRDGKNKAEALQQAKLQFLATTNQETDHPYYWGGFYLLGDTAAIQLESNNYGYWFIGVGILVLILVSLFWYRKRNSPLERG